MKQNLKQVELPATTAPAKEDEFDAGKRKEQQEQVVEKETISPVPAATPGRKPLFGV